MNVRAQLSEFHVDNFHSICALIRAVYSIIYICYEFIHIRDASQNYIKRTLGPGICVTVCMHSLITQ